jgi:hypothetical protein
MGRDESGGPAYIDDNIKTGYRKMEEGVLRGFSRFRVRSNVNRVMKLRVTEQ